MITNNENKQDKVFLTILADGRFHQSVPEGTEGAVVREYEDKNGEAKTKTELVHDSVKGIITNVSFVDGEYGKSIQIEIDSEIISTGTTGNFGEDLMKKLPAIDLSKEVTLTPYAFTPKGETGTKKGVSVYQDGIKIDSFYWDKEAKKSLHKMPEPEGDVSKFDSDDWKMHFMVVRKFLIKNVEKLSVFTVAEIKDVKDSKDNF